MALALNIVGGSGERKAVVAQCLAESERDRREGEGQLRSTHLEAGEALLPPCQPSMELEDDFFRLTAIVSASTPS